MYPSSSPSSSQKPMGPTGLTRYGSAPGSLLTTAVDSLIGPNTTTTREFSSLRSPPPPPTSLLAPQQQQQHQHHNLNQNHHYFSSDSSSITSESTCKVNSSNDPKQHHHHKGLERSYGLNEMSSSLVRQRSSPAGFLSHLASASDNGTLRPYLLALPLFFLLLLLG